MRIIFRKWRFVVRETTIKVTVNNENGFKEKRVALICVMNEDTGIIYKLIDLKSAQNKKIKQPDHAR